MPELLRYGRHALRQMAARRITKAEVEEVWISREITSQAPASPPHTGSVLVIRSRTIRGRPLKLVVSEPDERFVITVSDRNEER